MSTQQPPPVAGARTVPVPSPRRSAEQGAARSLAGFEVVAELGRGAHSTVLRVRRSGAGDESTTEYALKILDQVPSGSDQALVAFRREAALLASVAHPGLTVIHEVGEYDGRPYLVMDVVEGVPLRSLIAAGPLAPQQVIRLARDVVGPLVAVHRRGLIHRDLKPDNIMVSPSGTARLIDFGLAVRGAVNDTGSVVGTLVYCPPEQSGLLRRPVDHRSDLYSLGVVLFECLAGVPPFRADQVGELLRMHAVTPPPDLDHVVPGLPPGLAALVVTLLAKDPDDRYQSGEELAADLEDLAADAAASPAPRTAALAVARAIGMAPVMVGRRAGPDGDRLAGRAAELDQLAARWALAHDGDGQICVIRGAAGGGKSRLAAELGRQVGAQGALVLHGKSSSDDPVPLAPLRGALEAYLAGVTQLPTAEREPIQDRLRAAAGPAAGLVGSLTPALGALFGTASMNDGEDQFTLAVAGFLTGLAREFSGVLVLLDDLQWLDRGTARVLRELSGLLVGVPLLVVGTARDDPESAANTEAVLASLDGGVSLDLELGPLDDAGVTELVHTLLPGLDADPALTRLLAVRGNGNPFVTREYLWAIVDAGLLRPSWGTWVLNEEALDALDLPQDALGLVLTRVDNLGQLARELLITAAAIGTRFSPALVAAVHGLDLDVVLAACVEAAGRGLIAALDDADRTGRYVFVHDRIREALHQQLDDHGSALLHQQIAQTMDAVPAPDEGHRPEHVYAVAHHFLAGLPEHTPERVVAVCWAAGQLALDNHAPGDAVAFLESAVRLPGIRPPGFLLTLGRALKESGRYPDALERLGQALQTEPEPLSRAEILTLVAEVHRSGWRTKEAVEAVKQGLAELDAALPRNPFLLVFSTMAMFIAAQFMQWTGWGAARGADRVRCELIAGLHEVGAYAMSIEMRFGEVLVHHVRAVYWVNQLGSGEQYARSQATFGFLCRQVGLRRGSRRAFARVAADPASGQPQVQALTAYYDGVSEFVGCHDNGQTWVRCAQQHGQWLDVSVYCDAVSVFVVEAAAAGRTSEAAQWLALGQRRLALHAGQVNTLVFAEPWVHAIAGRPAKATTALQRVDDVIEPPTTGMTLVASINRLFVLNEQNEIGEPFDRTVAQFEATCPSPLTVIRPHLWGHVYVVMGRLAQCRAAAEGDRQARLQVARAAVRRLRKAARSDALRSWARIAQAELLVLEGQPRRALAIVAGIDVIHEPAAPLLAYEAARVQARALAAMGGLQESGWLARLAAGIAEENGWPHRVRWVIAEFGQIGGAASTGVGNATRNAHGPTETLSRSLYSLDGGRGVRAMAAEGLLEQRLAALQQLGTAASRVVDPAELARIALDETIRILGADRAFLFLTDAEDELQAYLGRDAAGGDVTELTGYSATLVRRVYLDRQPLVVTGAEEGAALGAQSVVLHGLRSIMVAPLQLDGRMLGVVYLDSQVAKGIFSTDDVGILIALTTHVATALETARAAQLEISVQTARRQRDLADTLRQALEAMTATFEPQLVLDRLLLWAQRVVACDLALLLTASAATTSSEDWHLQQDGHLDRDQDGCTVAELGADGGVSRRRVPDEPALLTLLSSDTPVVGCAAGVPQALIGHLAATSWIALPLRAEGVRLGVLVLASPGRREELEQQLEVASALVAQAVTAHERASLFAKVQSLAVADELTGIANRRRFFDVADRDVAACLGEGRPLAAMMIDIDHFKQVNDTLGHPSGDDVIRTVARRVSAEIGNTDLLGRYGGEEFAVLLPDIGIGAGLELAERLRAGIADLPVQTRSGPVDVTVSIGLTHLQPGDTDIAALLARADQALYRAKRDGRNRVRSR